MRKIISVLGMDLDNSSYSEALTRIEMFLSDTALSTVLSVDTHTLILAEQNTVVEDQLREADYTVICDTAVLEASGNPSFSRTKEISSRNFFDEFMKLIYHLDQSVCLIGGSLEENRTFRRYLESQYAHINIIGEVTASEQREENETAVNTINTITPDVILSILPSPLQEEFLQEHKQQISARIWYGLLPGADRAEGTGGLRAKIRHYMRRNALRSRVKQYEEEHH